MNVVADFIRPQAYFIPFPEGQDVFQKVTVGASPVVLELGDRDLELMGTVFIEKGIGFLLCQRAGLVFIMKSGKAFFQEVRCILSGPVFKSCPEGGGVGNGFAQSQGQK